ALQRVAGCEFRVAVFTNLTRDHLDFHGDMDSYFQAKRTLFSDLLRADGRAIVNADDDRAGALAKASRAPVWTYALEAPADFRAEDIRLGLEGTRFLLRSPLGTHEVESALVGRFNVQNLLAAFAASLAAGVAPEVARRGLATVLGVPGR